MTDSAVVADTLYERDFVAWLEEQAALLRAGKLRELDIENVIEELEAMARSERRELESRLRIVLLHMIKQQYQPEKRTRSWDGSIATQRAEAHNVLRTSPSLRRHLPVFVLDAYRDARKIAAAETGLPIGTFPRELPYSLAEVLPESD